MLFNIKNLSGEIHIGDLHQTYIGEVSINCKQNNMKAPWKSIIKSLDQHKQSSLAEKFSRLFALTQQTNLRVKEAWNPMTNDWNIQPCRPLLERDLSIWNVVKSHIPSPDERRGIDQPIEAKQQWSLTFHLSKKLCINRNPIDSSTLNSQAFKRLWKSTISQKCKFRQSLRSAKFSYGLSLTRA